MRIASTREERQSAFKLTYQAYLQTGLCKPNPFGMRFTTHQLLPTTDIFIATRHGEVINTLSLVRDSKKGLPLEEIFPYEVEVRRLAGLRLAEVTCLADRERGSACFFALFCDLCRLMVQYAEKIGIDQLLVAVHPHHSCIYRRYMAFEQIGSQREYSAVQGNPAVALCLDLNQIQIHRPPSWDRFFGQRLPDKVLIGQPISEADRNYFLAIQSEMEPMTIIPFLPVSLEEEEHAEWKLAKCI
ncbi:MAG: long-chain N-acyl amino acid synthase [Pirellulales bacterium]|nr:long-chain N-acyl amino acid synthase [Pirellulales bacterium]